MEVVYSPLCESSAVLYSQYLTTIRSVYGVTGQQLENGFVPVLYRRFIRGGSDDAGGNGGVDAGGSVDGGDGGVSDVTRLLVAPVGAGVDVGHGDDVAGGVDGDVAGRIEVADVGFASDFVGDSGGILSGSGSGAECQAADISVGQVLTGRGRHYAKNRAKRERAKQKRAGLRGLGPDGQRRSVRSDRDVDLRISLEKKWQAENALAAKRAEQELLLLEQRDLDQQAKCNRVKVLRATEQAMVGIEKAHGTLKATGNVPGFAETVVSGVPTLSDGSISPNSSISEAEVRKLIKDSADKDEEIAKLTKALLKMGVDPGDPDRPKEAWTLGSDGEPEAGSEVMAALFGPAYAIDAFSCSDGKVRARLS